MRLSLDKHIVVIVGMIIFGLGVALPVQAAVSPPPKSAASTDVPQNWLGKVQ